MSGKDNWLKLSVRFKGKCAVCGKEIIAGEGALWSKKEKTIKHVDCAPVGRIELTREREAKELECFICGRAAGCLECSFEPDCDRAIVSQACVCAACMDGGDAYAAYKEAFLARLRKLPKVKI